mgnify:CR=1 FL=1
MIDTSYIATPHIAGYSIEGRLNGAKIIAKECAKIFKCLKPSETKTVQPSAWPYDLNNIVRDIHNVSFPISLFNSELDLKSISDSFKAETLNVLFMWNEQALTCFFRESACKNRVLH